MNDTFNKLDIPAIDNLRKYIDHTLVELSQQSEKQNMRFGVHNSIVQMCGVQMRLGNLDECLISLIECIK